MLFEPDKFKQMSRGFQTQYKGILSKIIGAKKYVQSTGNNKKKEDSILTNNKTRPHFLRSNQSCDPVRSVTRFDSGAFLLVRRRRGSSTASMHFRPCIIVGDQYTSGLLSPLHLFKKTRPLAPRSRPVHVHMHGLTNGGFVGYCLQL